VISVSVQGPKSGFNRKLIKGFEDPNMESPKTYAEPLYLAWRLRRGYFTVFVNI